MSGGKIIAYIFSGIIIFFGILLLWGSTSDEGSIYWLISGPVSIAILGLLFLYVIGRYKKSPLRMKRAFVFHNRELL